MIWPDCACGCGQPTHAYKHSSPGRGHFKGQPMPYIKGHTGGWPAIDWDDLVTTETGCQIFASYEYPAQGYRRMRWKGEPTSIHRVMWEKSHGPIPDGYLVHHRCENKKCINIEHLELLSWGEHTRLHKLGKPRVQKRAA
jgi:hypothetical protein